MPWIAMRKIWVPLVVLWLLPASYSLQRPAERPEERPTAFVRGPAIREVRLNEAGETILYFPDYVDGRRMVRAVGAQQRRCGYGRRGELSKSTTRSAHPVLDLFDSELTFEDPTAWAVGC